MTSFLFWETSLSLYLTNTGACTYPIISLVNIGLRVGYCRVLGLVEGGLPQEKQSRQADIDFPIVLEIKAPTFIRTLPSRLSLSSDHISYAI